MTTCLKQLAISDALFHNGDGLKSHKNRHKKGTMRNTNNKATKVEILLKTDNFTDISLI